MRTEALIPVVRRAFTEECYRRALAGYAEEQNLMAAAAGERGELIPRWVVEPFYAKVMQDIFGARVMEMSRLTLDEINREVFR